MGEDMHTLVLSFSLASYHIKRHQETAAPHHTYLVLGHLECLLGDQAAPLCHGEDVCKGARNVHKRRQEVGEERVVVPEAENTRRMV